jgi:hypothetical protein
MSKRVYVSIDIAVTTAQENTPVHIRIQVSAATVKALHARLQQAYLKDDGRLVRWTTHRIDARVHRHGQQPMERQRDVVDTFGCESRCGPLFLQRFCSWKLYIDSRACVNWPRKSAQLP